DPAAIRQLKQAVEISWRAMVEYMMGALLEHQLPSLLRACRPNHGQAGGPSKLDAGAAHPSTCAVHQHNFAGKSLSAKEQAAIGRRVGHPNTGTLREAHAIRQEMNLRRLRKRAFRIRAADSAGSVDPISSFHALALATQRLHNSGGV